MKSHLTRNLRTITPLDTTALPRVAGGESASTSTSGTPEAGDDTIGDRTIWIKTMPTDGL